MAMSKASLERQVRELARNRCEYCHIPDGIIHFPHVLDHVIARQHGGKSKVQNLVLCCGRCNQYKGPNIAGLDPKTAKLTPLFHPRRHAWRAHFRWSGARLIGITPIGRTTISVLSINLPQRLALRRLLIDEKRFPPSDDL